MTRSAQDLLHPLLATRSSPARFDPATWIDDQAVDSLLEAARWAPSAGNSQPWAFITARRGEPEHVRLCRHLARSSAAWAPAADLLVVNLRQVLVEGTDWQFSEFSSYDLGQAVAHMTIQAEALSLAVRQFRAFDRDRIAADFAVPSHWEVTTMSAVGHVDRGRTALGAQSSDGARGGRQRRPAADLRWSEHTPSGIQSPCPRLDVGITR